jgi:hypothetical protein
VFAVSKKQTEHSMVGNVLLLGQLNQGTWKPCEMERVLRGRFICTIMFTNVSEIHAASIFRVMEAAWTSEMLVSY